MANQTPIYPGIVRTVTLTISNNNLTGTSTQNTNLFYTANTSGARIDSMSCVNNDTVGHNVAVYLSKGSAPLTNTLIGVVFVPAGAGNSSTQAANSLLNNPNMTLPITDPYGNKVLYIEASGNVSIQSTDIISNQKSIIVSALVGEY